MDRKLSYLTIVMVFGIISTYYLMDTYIFKLWLLIYIGISIMRILMIKKLDEVFFVMVIYGLGAFIVLINMKASILPKFMDQDVEIMGWVVEKNEIDDGINNYIIKTQNLYFQGKDIRVNEKTRLKVIGMKRLEIGDQIVFLTSLKEPRTNTNPKLYNFRKNLHSKKIFTTSTIRDHRVLSIKKGEKIFLSLKNLFRKRVEGIFIRYLNGENWSLMTSIVLGDQSYLLEEDILAYRSLGLSHILAISGLHIGIIGSFFLWFLSSLGIKRRNTTILVLFTIWAYSFLIGLPVSALRACIMLSLSLIAKSLVEPYDPINNLFFSMLILLLVNPFYIFNLGFQLSYMASLSLLIIGPCLEEVFYPLKNKLIKNIIPILSVQLGILPLQAYYFNELSILNILSNIIMLPIVSLGLIIGFLMVIFSFLCPYINSFFGLVLDIILSGERTIRALFLNFPYLTIKLKSPGIWEIYIYFIFLFIVIGIIDLSGVGKKFTRIISLWTLVFVVSINLVQVLDKSLYLDFIDVGQGDAVLVHSSGKNYLIDTGGEVLGGFKVGENISLPFLMKNGFWDIDGLFISHFHEDHCRAAPLLIDKLNIKNILFSYDEEDSPIYREIMLGDLPIHRLKKGDIINGGNGLKFTVVSPDSSLIDGGYSENNKSLVLLLEYGTYRILFTGDMEKEVEKYLINEKKIQNLDIIKIPHHGSKTSSTGEFLKHTRPRVGIFTVGLNNLFNHPDKGVVARYESLGTDIHRTDQEGHIRIRINKDGIRIDPFLHGEEINISLVIVYLLSFLDGLILIYTYKKDRERFLIEL